MGNQVDYLASLNAVVEELAKDSHVDTMWEKLRACWYELEEQVQVVHLDVFNQAEIGERLELKMKNILGWLYRMPLADYPSDLHLIHTKDAEYGGSWQKRGGVGAFMMMARKWDRIEKQVSAAGTLRQALLTDRREEGLQDDFRDLRGYLALVLAWRRSRKLQLMQGDPF